MAGVVRALLKQPNTYYVDIGNWTESEDRQDELKADALATLFADLKPAYLNVGPLDARMSEAKLDSLAEMTGGLLNRSGDPRDVGPLQIRANTSLPYEGGKKEVLLLAAGKAEAERAATGGPGLIVYSVSGDPAKDPTTVGTAVLVSSGDRCRNVGRIELIAGKWTNFTLIELGPEKADDPHATAVYKSYLQRVADENLLDVLPRTQGPVKYAGSKSCASCHAQIYEDWKGTSHAHAYATLQSTGNDRDPECVGCHVVGLGDTSGFKSLKMTPKVANVGCESCHGPGSKHNRGPYAPYGGAGEQACLPCHTLENSPGFSFKEYWPKIKH